MSLSCRLDAYRVFLRLIYFKMKCLYFYSLKIWVIWCKRCIFFRAQQTQMSWPCHSNIVERTVIMNFDQLTSKILWLSLRWYTTMAMEVLDSPSTEGVLRRQQGFSVTSWNKKEKVQMLGCKFDSGSSDWCSRARRDPHHTVLVCVNNV